jgi:hypothetical protein
MGMEIKRLFKKGKEKMVRKMLKFIGLALEKDYAKADTCWIVALNHIAKHLFNPKTPMPVIKNLVELLCVIDYDGNELINDWMTDLKSRNGNKEYLARLNVICPIIIKEQKKLEKGNK